MSSGREGNNHIVSCPLVGEDLNHYDTITLVHGCKKWAEEGAPKNFDSDFIDSLYEQIEYRHHDLTQNQLEALHNIIITFEIPADYFE